jgi:hypothetical protein
VSLCKKRCIESKDVSAGGGAADGNHDVRVYETAGVEIGTLSHAVPGQIIHNATQRWVMQHRRHGQSLRPARPTVKRLLPEQLSDARKPLLHITGL